MAKRRRSSNLGIAVSSHVVGYPSHSGPRGPAKLKDFHGNTIGVGHVVNCTKVKPWQRGGMDSNYRCSYQFEIRRMPYACRGTGDGMFASCRRMAKSVRR